MFWGLSTLSQTTVFIVLLVNKESIIHDPDDTVSQFQSIITIGVMAILSMILFALGLWNKAEYRYNENRGRNYLQRTSKSKPFSLEGSSVSNASLV